MPGLYQFQLGDVIPFLPGAEPFDPTNRNSLKKFDLFMCALGFEPRCLTLPDALERSGHRATRATYFEYSTNLHDNEASRPQLLQHLNRLSKSVHPIEADGDGFADRLRNLLEVVAGGKRRRHVPMVVFDISSVANGLLMKSMKVLLESNIRLVLLYSEAAIYFPTREQVEAAATAQSDQETALHRGVSNVTVSNEQPGYHVDQLPDCLVLFPGFSRERSLAAISEVDPSLLLVPGDKVIWLLGTPHLQEDMWRLDFMRITNQILTSAPQYEISTFDYREALRGLESIYQDRVGACKFTVSPMGSKMQALGVALFCHVRPDVRVIFVTPKEYNAGQYSEGCKATWILNFGNLTQLKERLQQLDMLEVRR